MGQLLTSFGKTGALCTIVLFCFRVGLFVLLAGSLLKNYRIYKIFSNKTASAISITESRLLLYLGIATLLFTVFLVVVVTALGYDAIILQSSKDQFYQYVECKIPDSKAWNLIIKILLELLIIFLIIFSLIIAWITRKVDTSYRESRELVTFSIVIAAALIIFIPLNFTLNDGSNSEILKFVIQAEILSVTVIAAFALLFFPKVYAVLQHK